MLLGVFVHKSLYECTFPLLLGVHLEVQLQSEKIGLLSALLNIVRLLSRVAVSNCTWNNTV